MNETKRNNGIFYSMATMELLEFVKRNKLVQDKSKNKENQGRI